MSFFKPALLLMLFTLLIACSKIDKAHFDQVKEGMSMAEVTAILGDPTESQTMGVGPLSGTNSTWKQDNVSIQIQFFNDQVKLKNFSQ
ncbi:DUF3862 domain-containing protein [Candidatus Venteria ishoeyi]|uniref:DUF3862 domain-containing protein n=1 Tax=Candidatus Venteria ishoeyi TaxID=1899563 RepID=UPI0025A67608|nr:DUF3862 domain-containing protein [Candidatus Venteria ishoeyi]MDM8548369.1 DUF3862 domain-containing protein [Candidatus Venteria ishoeyi]